MPDVTLLPCKVCGSERAVPVRYEPRFYGPYWRVCCVNCEYNGPARQTKEEAAAAWNARVPDPRIAALEAQLADARDCIDLFNRMIVRAECAWKEQHPDSEFYPDVPDLIVWLKEQVDTLAARRCETCAHYDERGWCEINARTYPGNGFCSEWEAALLPPDDGRCRSCADAPFCNEDHRRDCLTLHPPKEAADAGS